MKKYSVSAFFPAYNEEKNIPRLVEETTAVLKEYSTDYEIIIVNDGSKDRTAEVVREIAEKDPHVKLVDHVVNKGYGAAVISGFAAAKNELVFFSDSDIQFSMKEIPLLMYGIEDVDVVCGYRHQRQDPAHRRFNAWGWRTLVNVMFGLGITDIDCAFKLFRREILERIDVTGIGSQGAAVNTELLLRLKLAGAKLKEFPVSHYSRVHGTQTGAKLSVIFKAFKELYRLWLVARKSDWKDSFLVSPKSKAPIIGKTAEDNQG